MKLEALLRLLRLESTSPCLKSPGLRAFLSCGSWIGGRRWDSTVKICDGREGRSMMAEMGVSDGKGWCRRWWWTEGRSGDIGGGGGRKESGIDAVGGGWCDRADACSKRIQREDRKQIHQINSREYWQEQDMSAETKSSVVKVKPSNQDGSSSKVKADSFVNKKKVVNSSTKQPVDSKHKSATTVTKTEVKTKTTSSSLKTTTTKTTVRARGKKVYTLQGQKYDVPEEREPLRIFYESLSKQIPSSEMAEFWMMEHGLLSPERAKKAYEKKQRKQKQLRMATPVKSPPPLPQCKPESSKKLQQGSKNGEVKSKKRIMNDTDDDDDFILSPKRRKG
ncbi:hypothetical protein F0562_007114 [Nyssa sinensis]|uniref:Uncharacterized protein n=1 Tax=Nyssa sinensis TaxID=561372 RepID=A0A5J5A4G3_9ASTE|nr:hypothetical protein F0562_007114 [Nyssa sinensis]